MCNTLRSGDNVVVIVAVPMYIYVYIFVLYVQYFVLESRSVGWFHGWVARRHGTILNINLTIVRRLNRCLRA